MSVPALGPRAALVRSWALFRARPAVTLALGTALFGSLISVCCGLGLFAVPWFMCELLRVLLGSALGRSPARSRAWFSAAFAQLLGLLVMGLIACFALLALGPELVLGAPGARSFALRFFDSLPSLVAAMAFASVLTVQFQYAPLLLIERGGTLIPALFESVRRVSAGGLVRSWLSSLVAHALPLAMLACLVALHAWFRSVPNALLASVLLALPTLGLATALLQGMLVSSYLAERAGQRDMQGEPRARSYLAAQGMLGEPRAGSHLAAQDMQGEPRAGSHVVERALQNELRAGSDLAERALSGEALQRPLASRSSALLFAPMVGLVAGHVAVALALLRPAPIPFGALPDDAALLIDASISGPRELFVPDSALRLVVEARRVRVVASDGGGAGVLPLPRARIERVRVARSAAVREPGRAFEPGYAIEITQAEQPRHATAIDAAGVRSDDSLKQRFAASLPDYASALLKLTWLWLALWMGIALPRQARLFAEGEQRAFDRHARAACALLAPATLLALFLGGFALLRG